MKKSLLALAVLAGFAGAASAQTNVTIYGLVDASLEWSNPDRSPSVWGMRDANTTATGKNGSRLGFRGTEDLGGGLSAIFVMENGFNVDDGSPSSTTVGGITRIFGRQAWVGLQGGFGAVKLGRQYTPMHLALDSIDPFGTGMAGNITRQFNNNGTRTDNTVNFSMNAAGLVGQVAYTFGEDAASEANARQIAAGLGFVNGPVNAQFAYHDANNATNTGDTRTALLGATYNLSVVKLHAAVQTNKTEAGGVDTLKDRNYMLGVSAPVGVGEVRASVVRSDDRLATDSDADQLALGYVHNLSKRTNVYTSAARTIVKNNQTATNNGGNVFNVGVQHKF